MSVATDAKSNWSRWFRVAVSLAIAYHFLAVLTGPLSLPESMLTGYIRPYVRQYMAIMYLGHSYKFFAPDPGPSHLVAYDVELRSGEHLHGLLPDIKQHQPRLFYHRHFMLSEFVNIGRDFEFWNTPLPGEDPGLQLPVHPHVRSYAEHLQQHYQARSVRIDYRIHRLSSPQEILDGKRLDEPDTYRSRHLLTLTGDAS